MALPVNGSTHLIPAYYSFYRPRKDERLSWPNCLTCSGWLTHISGHPSAAGRAQDRESSPARERRSTTVPPRHQLNYSVVKHIVSNAARPFVGTDLERVAEDRKRVGDATEVRRDIIVRGVDAADRRTDGHVFGHGHVIETAVETRPVVVAVRHAQLQCRRRRPRLSSARLQLTQFIPGFQRAAQTVLGVYIKRTCSRVTSASSHRGRTGNET